MLDTISMLRLCTYAGNAILMDMWDMDSVKFAVLADTIYVL